MTDNNPNLLKRISQKIVAVEWLLLVLILPLVLFPTPVRVTALLFIPILWLARRVAHGHFVVPTPLNWPMFGLLLMVLVSLYATFDIDFSLGKITGMIYGIAVFFAAVAFSRQSFSHLWRGVSLFLLSGLGVAALGLLGTRWTHKFPLLSDLISLLPQQLLTLPGADSGFSPNQLAGVLLWIAPLAIVLTLLSLRQVRVERRRPFHNLLILLALLGVTLIIVGMLLLSQSRGGLLGFGVGIIFIGAVYLWTRSRRFVGGLLVLSIAGAVIAANFMSMDQLTSLFFEQTGLSAGTESIISLEGRIEIWSRAIYGIQDFPFTGMGMNNFRRVVPILYPLFLIPPDTDIAHAHNHLLQAALDLGIPGLIAYLALWLAMAAMLWQVWQRAISSWLKGLALGFAGSLLAHFVYGLTDAVALGAKPGFIFWLLVGLITSLYSLVWEQNTAVPSI